MEGQAEKRVLDAKTMAIRYESPSGWSYSPRSPIQKDEGTLFRHLLYSEGRLTGLVAIATWPIIGEALGNDDFLMLVSVEGRITELRKQCIPFNHSPMTGYHWSMDFNLNGIPYHGDIYALGFPHQADSSMVIVSSWGKAEDQRPAEQIALSLESVGRMNPARKKGMKFIVSGTSMSVGGLILTAITQNLAQNNGTGVYAVFWGLIIVGAIVLLQGLWKLLRGKKEDWA